MARNSVPADILFVTLSSRQWGKREELGIGYVAAAADVAGYRSRIAVIELDAGWQEILEHLGVGEPLALGIGFSHSGTSLPLVSAMLADVRHIAPNIHITAGGYFATFNAASLLDALPGLDSVVCGEGEETTVALLSTLRDGRSLAEIEGLRVRGAAFRPRTKLPELDTIAPPVRIELNGQVTHPLALSTSRGCMAHCTFCNVPAWTRTVSRGWRGKSPDGVAEEIRRLVNATGKTRFWVVDSSFEDGGDAELDRVRAIANAICDRDLKIRYYVFMRAETVASAAFDAVLPSLLESGLRRIFVGVESGTDERLKSLAKRADTKANLLALEKLRRSRVAVRAGWIMLQPDSTTDTLIGALKHLAEMSLLHSTADLFSQLEVYEGAAEVNRLRKKGLLKAEYWHDPFAYDFEDQRIAMLARSMRDGKLRWSDRWDGEAMHTAELVLCSAHHEPGVMSRRGAVDLIDAAAAHLEDLKGIQARANALFFEELLSLTADRSAETRMATLIDEHMSRFHLPTADAARSISSTLLADLQAQGFHVSY